MGCEAGVNYVFKDFRDEVKVRDGSVAGKIIWWQVVFFKSWRDDGSLKYSRERTFRKREIDDVGDGNDEGINTGFEKTCGNNIEGAGGVRGGKNSRSDFISGSRTKVGEQRWRSWWE